MSGCSDIGGGANAPVPWIGFYIALTSLACALAMAADLLSGVRQRKLHFPSRYFSLNSATLALLGVATKLPGDLTTSMPSRHDQLSKLSGTALLCTAITNFMPSLVDMSASEAIANTIAIIILAVPIVADVSIQMGTRIIYKFIPEHGVLLFLLVLPLIILCSAALSAGPTNELLQRYYKTNFRMYKRRPVADRLIDSLKFYWVTAQFFSPRYVFGYSEVCTAAGALSLVVAGVLVEAVIRSTTFCDGTSDYRWSTTVVLFAQVIAVGIGTIAPACRWLTAVRFSPDSLTHECRQTLFPRSTIWTQRLREWKESALPHLGRTGIWQSIMKTSHQLRNFIIQALIVLHSRIMLGCYFVRFVSIKLGRSCERALRIRNPVIYFPRWKRDFVVTDQDFMVSSFGELVLARENLNRLPKDLNGWIQKGTRRQPTHLMELIQQHSTARDGFTTAGRFDRDGELPGLTLPKPPECWGLPLVTLATIAACLPGLEKELLKPLLDGVRQGLQYVNAVDEYHASKQGRINLSTRKVTERVWTNLVLYNRWFGEDLCKFQLNENNGRSALEKLKITAGESLSRTFTDTKPAVGEQLFKSDQEYMAYTYLYMVSNTIFEDWGEATTSRELFDLLRTMISDNMAACLTNLPSVICHENSTILYARLVAPYFLFMLMGVVKFQKHRCGEGRRVDLIPETSIPSDWNFFAYCFLDFFKLFVTKTRFIAIVEESFGGFKERSCAQIIFAGDGRG